MRWDYFMNQYHDKMAECEHAGITLIFIWEGRLDE